MIRIDGLTKSFGDRPVLRGIDLEVAGGECLALVGPNGTGKTTLLRILATLTRHDSGQVHICGLNLAANAPEIRRKIGFLSHQPLLYEDLSPKENLRFYGHMYDVPDLENRIGVLLRQVALESHDHELVRTFSRGMRQRLSVARALLHNPPVLLMDEPYTGLDRQAAAMLDDVFRNADGPDHTILFTTHDLDHGWQISNRAAILVGGRITYETRVGADGQDTNAEMSRLRHEYERQTG